jgi:hypothetical protein
MLVNEADGDTSVSGRPGASRTVPARSKQNTRRKRRV